jgi:hypothetical protein
VIEYDAGPSYFTQTGQANPLVAQTGLFATQTGINLQGVSNSSAAWGDYDNDGFLDILLTGSMNSKIYRNNGDNTFTEQTGTPLPGVDVGSSAWGDYDNDGDLDILITGTTDGSYTGAISRIYKNNGNNTFTEQTAITLTGVFWSSVAFGDYDNDGFLDILLTGSTSTGTVSKIYRNNGNGNFIEQTGISLQPVSDGSVAWGDYDNDNDLDILLTGWGYSKIYRNNGDNTFTEQTGIILTGVNNSSAAWGDYDNDGDLDILLTGNGVAKIYQNNGNNAFTEQSGIILTGVNNSSAAWGDLDNDGNLDILITGYNPLSSAKVSKIYRNNGDNTFTEQTGIQLTTVDNSSVALGDYNNDGRLDILLTGRSNLADVSLVYRNYSSTTNTAPAAPSVLTSATNETSLILRWKRVTGDATPAKGMSFNVRLGTTPGGNNIVSPMSRLTGQRLVPLFGNAQSDSTFILNSPKKATYYWSVQAIDNGLRSGAFATEQSVAYSISIPASHVLADTIQSTSLKLRWNRGNGIACAVFALKGTSGTASPVNGTFYGGNSHFGSGSQIGTTGWYCVYNGPGDTVKIAGLEVLTNYIFHVIEYDPGMLYFTQTGVANPLSVQTGLFIEQTGITLPGNSNSTAVWGDYNNDGNLDFLLTGSSDTKIYQNNGNNTFSYDAGIILPGVSSSSAAWGDYDNDGYLDILLTGTTNGSSGGGISKIFRNNGNSTFTEQTTISLTGVFWSSVAWGDYDNDGYLDILLTGANSSGSPISKVYRNNGNNSFTEQTSITLQGINSGTAAWGDYDNDGDLDILLAGNWVTKIYRNNGDNTFTDQTGTGLPGYSETTAAWGDYDNDGDLDIILAGSGNTKICRNNGNNTFTQQTAISLTGVYSGSVVWGDFDNDGNADIILTGSTNGTLAGTISKFYRNNGDNTFTEKTGLSTGVYYGSASAGDYDNDGKLDLLLTGQSVNGNISKIFRNFCPVVNVAPAAPVMLAPVINETSLILKWKRSTGDATPSLGMSYNVRIGTTPGGYEVASPMTLVSGSRLVTRSGNAQSDSIFILRNAKKITYYYSVQAIDNGLLPGPFAAEQSVYYSVPQQASQVVADSIKPTSLKLSWTRGNGLACMVFAMKGNSGSAAPVNNNFYGANSQFGFGSQIGTSGWYCVYNGTGNSIEVTGLEVLTNYIFHVIEYDPGPLFYSQTGLGNPFSRSTGLFYEQTTISLPGINSGSATWGDYDNDGNLDVLMAGNSGTGYISKLYRNNGDNTFSEQTGIVLPGVSNSSAKWGDFDNDGDLDLLLTGNTGASLISKIYRNNGDNTFTEMTGTSLTGITNGSVAWGDYNNDGYLDILLTGYNGTNSLAKIYRNNGNQSFTEQTGIILPGVDGGSANWGDYDNDGDLDILLTGYSASGYISKIFRNNGNNAFTDQTGITLSPVGYGKSAWGDYDNDGDLDILLTGFSGSSRLSKIYRNNGDNTFTEQTGIILTGLESSSVAWGDFDNNGTPDIILTGSTDGSASGATSKFYRNNGNNTFTEQTGITFTGVYQGSLDVGDYNRDGKLDVLITGLSGTGVYTGIYSNACLTSNTPPAAPTALSETTSQNSVFFRWNRSTGDVTPAKGMSYNIRIGTFPGGGNVVSPMSHFSGSRLLTHIGNANSDSVFTLSNPKKGTYYWSVQAIDNGFAASVFAAERSFTYSQSVQASQLYADSIMSNGLRLNWIRGNGSACAVFMKKGNSGNAVPVNNSFYSSNSQFGSGAQIGTSGWYCVYNGTGSTTSVSGLEVFTYYTIHVIEYETGPAYYTQTGQSNPLITQTSLFTDQPGIPITGVSNGSVAWGDYNNDSYPDFILTGYNDSYIPVSKIYRNNGNNTFSEQTGILFPGVTYGSEAWGDYDNDGDLDLILTGTTNGSASGAISKIYRNNGDNTFTEQTAISLTGLIGSIVAWGDYDNDGYLDILMAGNNSAYNNITKIYRNNGNNSFTEQLGISLTGVNSGSLAWGDYDNDGYLDILLAGNGISKIYRNNGNNTFTDQTGITLTGVTNSSVAWGDYNNDGYLDILLTGINNVSVPVSKIYRNNGNNTFTELTGITLPGVCRGSVLWGDFDNDGNADIILTGALNVSSSDFITKFYRNNGDNSFTEQTSPGIAVFYSSIATADYDRDGRLDLLITGKSGIGNISRIYRNVASVTNNPPAAPTGLSATSSETNILLKWNRVAGDATPAKGMNYNVRIGTTPGGKEVVSPMSLASGSRLIPLLGNAQSDTLYIFRNPKKTTYYWSVQAIDNGLAPGAFAAEQPLIYSISNYAGHVVMDQHVLYLPGKVTGELPPRLTVQFILPDNSLAPAPRLGQPDGIVSIMAPVIALMLRALRD